MCPPSFDACPLAECHVALFQVRRGHLAWRTPKDVRPLSQLRNLLVFWLSSREVTWREAVMFVAVTRAKRVMFRGAFRNLADGSSERQRV